MIRDFVLNLLAFFIIDPFRAELNQKLAQVQAPAEIVQQVQRCATAAAPSSWIARSAIGGGPARPSCTSRSA